MSAEYMQVHIATYQRLVQDSRKLEALEAAGVDNWDGYDYAMEILNEQEDE